MSPDGRSGNENAEGLVWSDCESQLHQIFANAPIPILLWTAADGKIQAINKAFTRITGYRLEDIPTKQAWMSMALELDEEAALALLRDELKQLTASQEIAEQEITVRTRDGKYRNWILRCTPPLPLHDGQQLIASMALDITAQLQTQECIRRHGEEMERRVARRTEDLARQSQQLRLLAAALTETEQRERRRMAHIIHDDLQQLLAAAKMSIARLRGQRDAEKLVSGIREAGRILDEAMQVAQNLSKQLRPPVLYERGLKAALEWLAEAFSKQYDLQLVLNLREEAEPEQDHLKAFLFEAVRELLFNIVKYADVSQAEVVLEGGAGQLHVCVTDTGRGFDPAQIDQGGGGFGLFSIRERLTALGGKMVLDAQVGRGARIHLYVPTTSAQSGLDVKKEPVGSEDAAKLHKEAKVVIVSARPLLRHLLERFVAEVTCCQLICVCTTAEQALGCLREGGHAAILIDEQLSGVDIFDFVGTLSLRNMRLYTIVLVGDGDPEQMRRFKQVGASEVISFDDAPERIVETLTRLGQEVSDAEQ